MIAALTTADSHYRDCRKNDKVYFFHLLIFINSFAKGFHTKYAHSLLYNVVQLGVIYIMDIESVL
jgi:hypothetical protein